MLWECATISKWPRCFKRLPPDLGERGPPLQKPCLKRIPGISQLCNLKKLILSKNDIVNFPKEIQSLVHLEKLDLNQNQIRVIPEGIFSCLLKLKHLRLNNNRLRDLPKDLAACQGSLQYLNLSNNLFQDIPQAVLDLASLQDFYIQNNMLHQLPVGLFTGRPLKMFKANGNPLREPPSEVCAGGIRQILSYFSQLQTCQVQEDRRVKTMFLGASLAGKSTICKSLFYCIVFNAIHKPTWENHICNPFVPLKNIFLFIIFNIAR
uniref:Uncharacterized protein n=1 Tax=Crocodylus porosus TaxID=8502 RepID=A0A7M4ET22_CROPO